ncbi:hypothetical protein HDU79_008413 [Rhizoclosmatium sp. JEL0117]|nr:hypothetical protein HDU79_008413 [Rhizoclosmatium sp. JEL0117]
MDMDPVPPPTKKGRPRKDATSASDKRAAQNREAANRYRQRKDERIKQLEQENEMLRRENANLRETMRNFNLGLVSASAFQTPAATAQPYHPLQAAATPTAAVSTESPDGWLDDALNALDQFGPPQVLATRFALKSLESLQGCREVDEMLDLFLIQAQCSDQNQIRRYFIKILKLRSKIFARCTPQDYEKVMEIIEICKVNNRAHVKHLYETTGLCDESSMNSPPASSSEAVQSNALPYPVLSFRQAAITCAPTVLAAQQELDSLCTLFTTQLSVTTPPPSLEDRKIQLFEGRKLENKILDACSLEDRIRLGFLLETWREVGAGGIERVLLDGLQE